MVALALSRPIAPVLARLTRELPSGDFRYDPARVTDRSWGGVRSR